MPVLEWSAFASADLIRIIVHIADENPTAAQKLKDRIEGKVSRLLRHPRLYRRGRVEGTRKMVVHRNYIVVYAEDARTVRILRILHAKQRWPYGRATGQHRLRAAARRLRDRSGPAAMTSRSRRPI